MKIRLAAVLIFLFVLRAAAQPLPLPQPRADDGSIIDVLVVYTQNARAIAGGTHPQTITMIQNSVNGVNQAFTSNGVFTQLNVVAYQPVFYLEQVNVDFHADLTNLTGTSDGYLDDIHALRDFYAADLVLMVAGTWFYIYTGDSVVPVAFDPALGFVVWEAKGLDDDGGIYPAQWIARTFGVDDTPPFSVPDVATMNANRITVANYRQSADRVIVPSHLAINGGFEVDMDANRVPDFWAASGWEASDRRACGVPANAHGGACSVKMALSAGGSDLLMLTADGGAVNINDDITFAGFAKTKGGGACVTVTLIVKFVSLPQVTQPVKTCLTTAGGWQPVSTFVHADDLVKTVKAKIKALGAGNVWLDDFDVVAAPAMARGGGR